MFKVSVDILVTWTMLVQACGWSSVLLSEWLSWILAPQRTNGAMERLVSLRQKENIYSKCWALKSFVTHHPLLRIVINPAFCQTALLNAARCQGRTPHAKYLQAGFAVCAAAPSCSFLSLWFHLCSQDQPSLYWSVVQWCRSAIQTVNWSNTLVQRKISWQLLATLTGLMYNS